MTLGSQCLAIHLDWGGVASWRRSCYDYGVITDTSRQFNPTCKTDKVKYHCLSHFNCPCRDLKKKKSFISISWGHLSIDTHTWMCTLAVTLQHDDVFLPRPSRAHSPANKPLWVIEVLLLIHSQIHASRFQKTSLFFMLLNAHSTFQTSLSIHNLPLLCWTYNYLYSQYTSCLQTK